MEWTLAEVWGIGTSLQRIGCIWEVMSNPSKWADWSIWNDELADEVASALHRAPSWYSGSLPGSFPAILSCWSGKFGTALKQSMSTLKRWLWQNAARCGKLSNTTAEPCWKSRNGWTLNWKLTMNELVRAELLAHPPEILAISIWNHIFKVPGWRISETDPTPVERRKSFWVIQRHRSAAFMGQFASEVGTSIMNCKHVQSNRIEQNRIEYDLLY